MNWISYLLSPNKYSVIGLLLLILGFFTAPFIIGFFIMPVGAALLVFGIHLTLYRLIPGHKRLTQTIINSYKPYFKLWKKQ